MKLTVNQVYTVHKRDTAHLCLTSTIKAIFTYSSENNNVDTAASSISDLIHCVLQAVQSICTEFPMTETNMDQRPMQIQILNPHVDYKRSEAAV